jgi:preprotein translocase subunit SecD
VEKSWYWKVGFTVALVLVAVYFVLGSMPEEWQPTFVNTPRHIMLGLDLQGGVRLVYEIDVGKAYARRTEGYAMSAKQWVVREAGVPEDKVRTERLGNRRFALHFDEPFAKSQEMAAYFEQALGFDGCDADQKTCRFTLRPEVLENERQVSSSGVLKVIRERVDQHGLTEPNIAAQGMDIVVEVPQRSIEDVNRVKEIISKTASLEFRIVARDTYVDQTAVDYIQKDPRFQGKISLRARGGADYLEAQDTEAQSGREILQQFIEAYLASPAVRGDSVKASLWGRVYVGTTEGPSLGTGKGQQPDQQPAMWRTFLLEPEVMVTGDRVVNAAVRYDPNSIKDAIYVILDFDALGGEQFGNATEKNVGNLMAIVLDGLVRSAPQIIEPIKGGSCRITLGAGSPQEIQKEAEDLVVVLKAGALPAPLKQPPAAESRIGATLGQQAIRQGLWAAGVGLLLVVVFMAIYYKVAGLFADVALIVNMLLMLASLALLGATLTLPGITGFVLTMGMAVDANVIINERIREELRAGKSPRAAVDAGYARAFWTIFDSQITTFFAGIVLYQFGTGPIRGFAVTLMIGIIWSMFTGIFITRLFFDYITHKKRPATLSV